MVWCPLTLCHARQVAIGCRAQPLVQRRDASLAAANHDVFTSMDLDSPPFMAQTFAAGEHRSENSPLAPSDGAEMSTASGTKAFNHGRERLKVRLVNCDVREPVAVTVS